MAEEKWMQSASKHHGILKAYAKKMGKLNPDGTINKEWRDKLANSSGIWAKRAQLAQTYDKFRPKG